MRNDYSEHQVEAFIKTLIVGGVLGFALAVLCQMFGWL